MWIKKHGCDPVVIADVSLLVCGRCLLPDLSLCLLHEPDLFIYLTVTSLANHSYVDLSEVRNYGSGSDSVQCYTDQYGCCSSAQGAHRGDWYFPNGTRLPFSGYGDIYEQREAQRVDLRRNSGANSPTGIYRCDIPTNAVHGVIDISVRDTVYVGLYTASGGMYEMHSGVLMKIVSYSACLLTPDK